MDQLNKFKIYLLQGTHRHSKITVKNYLADVRKFIFWYEKTFSRIFSAWQITPQIVNQYKTSLTSSSQQSTIASARSLKRYLSSLRKFYAFLLEQKEVELNPFDLPLSNAQIPADEWHIKEFENFLILSSASKPTIKNYLVDIKQFKDWVEKINASQKGTQSPTTTLEKLNSVLVDEYKNRLFYDAKLSAVSINRKLSSLRKYFSWAISKGFIKQAPAFGQMAEAAQAASSQSEGKALAELASLAALNSQPQTAKAFTYSRFPPFRLVQKLTRGSNYIFDLLILLPVVKILVAIRYNYWKVKGRKVFVPAEQVFAKSDPESTPRVRLITTNLDDFVTSRNNANLKNVSNFPKALYAPLQLSTKDLSLSKRLIFHLRYTRPKWYKRYHSYPVVHYIHFAIVIIYAAVVSLGVYQAWAESPSFHTPVLAALPGSPPRMLAFKGTLTDATNTPITAEQTLRFSLYNSSTSSGSALLWEETQEVKPDAQGNFSTMLGRNQPIYQNLLSDNPNLFIGVTIGRQPELLPRQQVATTAYSKDAEQLQGLLPITDPNAGTRNIILALNSSGDLTIGGTASPRFEATGGELTLSGQTLTLTTVDGSNSNIQLKPDGTGIVDIQKPIQNTSDYGMIPDLAGAVQFADSVGIITNSSSQSALLINQNSTGDIISASGSGIAKFTVNYLGAGTFADDLAINGNNLSSDSTTFNLLNTNVLTLNIGNKATEVTIASESGRTTINSILDVQGLITAKHGLSIPENQKITLSGLTSGGITFLDSNKQFVQDPTTLFWDQSGKRLGLGTNTPVFRLDVRDSQATGAVAQIYNTDIGGTARGLDIKLGNSTPGPTNSFIRFLGGNGDVLGEITGSSSASIAYKTNNADYAEYFKKADIFESFEPGDVVCLINGGVTKCQDNNSILGVVSATAGFVGAGNHDNDPTYVLVGLVGQLPVKIQPGLDIKSGDPLTLSNGSVVKATGPGIILGRALENQSAKLLPVALNITWYGTNAALSPTGNLSLWEASQPKVNQSDPLKDYIVSIINETLTSMPFPGHEIISPLATVDRIKTNIISPLSSDDQIALKFEEDKIAVINPKVSTSSAVATIDNEGNARFAGNLQAHDASLSGTLHVKKIIADEIEGLNIQTATIAASYITNVTNVYNNIATTSADSSASPSADTNLIANNQPGSVNANFAKFDQGFISLGASSLTDVAVTGRLRLGNNLVLSDNSINTVGTDLALQPLRQGSLSLMGDLIKIDTEGNLNVGGNAVFAKNVAVQGILSANIIAPVPDQDLLIRLPTSDKGKESKVEIQTASGSGVLSINQLGNLISSGSANFMDITAKTFTIIRGAQADTSFTRTVTDSSAGSAVITAYETERTIVSPYMKKDSLIYITATSDTQGVTPYIARQTQDSFTIQIPHSVKKDIKINWWIVN